MKITEAIARRLLQEITDSIALDKMIDEIVPMTDAEIAEIEAQMEAMPPLTPEEKEAEEKMLKRAHENFMDYIRAWKEERE